MRESISYNQLCYNTMTLYKISSFAYPEQHKQSYSVRSKLIDDILYIEHYNCIVQSLRFLVKGHHTSGSTPLYFDFDIFSHETSTWSSLNWFDSISSGFRYLPLSFSRCVLPCTMPYKRKFNQFKNFFLVICSYLSKQLLERFLVLDKTNVVKKVSDEPCIEKVEDSCK